MEEQELILQIKKFSFFTISESAEAEVDDSICREKWPAVWKVSKDLMQDLIWFLENSRFEWCTAVSKAVTWSQRLMSLCIFWSNTDNTDKWETMRKDGGSLFVSSLDFLRIALKWATMWNPWIFVWIEGKGDINTFRGHFQCHKTPRVIFHR